MIAPTGEDIVIDGVNWGKPCPHGYPFGICSKCPVDGEEPR